jgi:hypothetical protein
MSARGLWESDASKRVMSDMRRDASNLSNNNDHFAIMLDTFYDRRNGYVFLANAQGGMMDAQVVNENADVNWNTIWETRAADFEGGWTIEFRIPFRSIRFSETSNVWGINFRRLSPLEDGKGFSRARPGVVRQQRALQDLERRDARGDRPAEQAAEHRLQAVRPRFERDQPHRAPGHQQRRQRRIRRRPEMGRHAERGGGRDLQHRLRAG